jgi:5-methylcytosine-specific restriction enzyme A
MCLAHGRVTRATVADHVIAHKGNYDLFWHGKLQSLCTIHHNSTKKQIETIGYSRHIGTDGWPTDPNHPANKIK